MCSFFVKFDAQNQIVYLRHDSVREYLMSESFPNGLGNPYFIDRLKGEQHILQVSLTYLCSLSEEDWQGALRREYDSMDENSFKPLLLYASFHWHTHAPKRVMEEQIFRLILDFLNPRKLTYIFWSKLFQKHLEQEPIRETSQPRHWEMEVEPHPIYYASLFGFGQILETLIYHDPEVNRSGGYYQYPLMAAIDNLDVNVVKILLDAGADVNLLAIDKGENEELLFNFDEIEEAVIGMLLLNAGAEVCGILSVCVVEIGKWLTRSKRW